MLKIGQSYTINRKRLQYYVDRGWDSTVLNDKNATKLVITDSYPDDRDKDMKWFESHNITMKKLYYVLYNNDPCDVYFPEDCFVDRINKLNRVLDED
jgi:hypothetical protein